MFHAYLSNVRWPVEGAGVDGRVYTGRSEDPNPEYLLGMVQVPTEGSQDGL
jgi:hypothetical protein